MNLSMFQSRQLELMRQLESATAAGSTASTLVSIQQDYATDPQLCLTIVTYLNPKLQNIIYDKLVEPLKKLEPEFYFFPKESLHITIQNIRTVADPPTYASKDVEVARYLLKDFTARHGKPFTFRLEGLLMLPTSLAAIALIEPAYDAFIKLLRTELAASGIPDNKTYFTDEMVFANTTFCRYTHPPSRKFLDAARKLRQTVIGEFTAREICLIETNAGCHPSKTVSLSCEPLG